MIASEAAAWPTSPEKVDAPAKRIRNREFRVAVAAPLVRGADGTIGRTNWCLRTNWSLRRRSASGRRSVRRPSKRRIERSGMGPRTDRAHHHLVRDRSRHLPRRRHVDESRHVHRVVQSDAGQRHNPRRSRQPDACVRRLAVHVRLVSVRLHEERCRERDLHAHGHR